MPDRNVNQKEVAFPPSYVADILRADPVSSDGIYTAVIMSSVEKLLHTTAD